VVGVTASQLPPELVLAAAVKPTGVLPLLTFTFSGMAVLLPSE
jgi:hypothetical protein